MMEVCQRDTGSNESFPMAKAEMLEQENKVVLDTTQK